MRVLKILAFILSINLLASGKVSAEVFHPQPSECKLPQYIETCKSACERYKKKLAFIREPGAPTYNGEEEYLKTKITEYCATKPSVKPTIRPTAIPTAVVPTITDKPKMETATITPSPQKPVTTRFDLISLFRSLWERIFRR
ncbi:MAG: hypothetical protein WC686_02940 [Candidatus Shapirobacteria bacterium]|jgi:hypothetical protein